MNKINALVKQIEKDTAKVVKAQKIMALRMEKTLTLLFRVHNKLNRVNK